MFVKWIVVPNFGLQIAYAQYCLAEVATDQSRFQHDSAFVFEAGVKHLWKTGPRVLFLAVTGVCMIFINVIASVQNKHCGIAVALMVVGDWTGVEFSNILNFEPQVRVQKLRNRSGAGVWKCDSGHLCCPVGYSAWFAVGLPSLLCDCLISMLCYKLDNNRSDK